MEADGSIWRDSGAASLAALLTLTAATALAQPATFDLQGHRGARGLMPENTLPAFRKALALGVDTLECDMAITRDGVVVTDSNGRIVVANPAFLALVQGLSEDDVRSQTIGAWVGRIDSDVSALLAGAHQHGIAHLVRSSVRRSDSSFM